MALTQSQPTPKPRFQIEKIVLGIVVLLLIIGAIFDKPISRTLMDQNSIFGTVFQNYSLIFPSIIIFMACQVLFYRIQKLESNAIGKFSVMFLTGIAAIYETWQAVKTALFYTIASLNISYKRFTHNNCPAIENDHSPGNSPKKNTRSVV